MKKYFIISSIFILFIIISILNFNYKKSSSDQLENEVNDLKKNLTPGVIEILNPTFINKGLDANPFEIAAKKGIQINKDIKLDQVTGKFTNKDMKLIYVSADKGFYSQNNQIIELDGNVIVYDDLGNKTLAENAIIDIEIKRIFLKDKVISISKTSTIKSNSSIVDQENDRITYTGNVNVKIKNE